MFWSYTISTDIANGNSFRIRCTVDFKGIVVEKYESDNVKEETYRVAAAIPAIQPVTSYTAPTNAQKAVLKVVQDLLLGD